MTQAGTGIAGAMDHAPTGHGGLACCVCGAEIHGGMKTAPSARAVPKLGLIHACSPACAKDDRFSGGWVLVPREATEAMIHAAIVRPYDRDARDVYTTIWRAMVQEAERETKP